jgi:hypothetical protein
MLRTRRAGLMAVIIAGLVALISACAPAILNRPNDLLVDHNGIVRCVYLKVSSECDKTGLQPITTSWTKYDPALADTDDARVLEYILVNGSFYHSPDYGLVYYVPTDSLHELDDRWNNWQNANYDLMEVIKANYQRHQATQHAAQQPAPPPSS